MGKYDDLYGLGDFGAGMMDDMLGGLVGGGLSSVVAAGARMSGNATAKKYSEGIGAAAGVLAGAVMYFATDRKGAGLTAMVTSAVTAGVRQLEALVSQPVSGYGLPSIAPTQVLRGGFGIATVEPTGAFQGFGDMSPQLVGPPQLVGANTLGNSPAAQQVALNGGPQISGLAGAYGATLFGG
jgi:hypothetical protein